MRDKRKLVRFFSPVLLVLAWPVFLFGSVAQSGESSAVLDVDVPASPPPEYRHFRMRLTTPPDPRDEIDIRGLGIEALRCGDRLTPVELSEGETGDPTPSLEAQAEAQRWHAVDQDPQYRERALALWTAALSNEESKTQKEVESALEMPISELREQLARSSAGTMFRQTLGGVPIEGTFAVWSEATRTLRGILLADCIAPSERETISEDVESIRQSGFAAVMAGRDLPGAPILIESTLPMHVLLPYDRRNGSLRLRRAWRMEMTWTMEGSDERSRMRVWLGAGDAAPPIDVLKVDSMDANVAQRRVRTSLWSRDPSGGQRHLFPSVLTTDDGSTSLQHEEFTKQVFIKSPRNDGPFPLQPEYRLVPSFVGSPGCYVVDGQLSPPVRLYTALYRDWVIARGLPGASAFPSSVLSPYLQPQGKKCTASAASPLFGACKGYFAPTCPGRNPQKLSVGTTLERDQLKYLNLADDNTVVSHEFGHRLVEELTSECGLGCSWSNFDDLADVWADHSQGTNCTAGWAARSLDGAGSHAACRQHYSGPRLPRLHSLPEGAPGGVVEHDVFPEYWMLGASADPSHKPGEYHNLQVVSAALWRVRSGMQSKSFFFGPALYAVQLSLALRSAGSASNGFSSMGQVYADLHNLERALLEVWAGCRTPALCSLLANKVLAGFARAGLFMVSPSCLGDTSSLDFGPCPAGANGGAAVIDVDDRDPDDDILVGGAVVTEDDFVSESGRPPRFQVWTGPRYRFVDEGYEFTDGVCHAEYLVEVSSSPEFTETETVDSGWQPAKRCYGEWVPDGPDWRMMLGRASRKRIFYRAQTRTGAHVLESTHPHDLGFSLLPPYLVVTPSGASPEFAISLEDPS